MKPTTKPQGEPERSGDSQPIGCPKGGAASNSDMSSIRQNGSEADIDDRREPEGWSVATSKREFM